MTVSRLVMLQQPVADQNPDTTFANLEGETTAVHHRKAVGKLFIRPHLRLFDREFYLVDRPIKFLEKI